MKLKLIALAAVLAAAGSANAAPIANGSDGNGGLFFSIWDDNNSYSRNLGYTIDSFASTVAGAGLVDLSFAADATFTSFLAAADLASLKWNVVAGDNVGTRRVVETFATLPATKISNDKVRGVTTGTWSFATALNSQLTVSDSTTFALGSAGYAGNAASFGDKAAGLLNFSNAGTLANNSAANGMNVMLITGLATGILASTYTPYADSSNAVKVYLDGSNALHISSVTAVPEADTYAMLLAGLGLMGAIARRRNKKSV